MRNHAGRESRVLGDSWERGETSADKWETSAHAKRDWETSWRQAWNHAGREKLETSLKSCGQRIQSVVGDNWETSAKSRRPKHSEHPECTARQAGHKPEIMRIMRAENPECSGRQLGDKWETSAKSCGPKLSEHPERLFCRKTSLEINAKSCGPSMQRFQWSKNPSQVNLFGENSRACENVRKAVWGRCWRIFFF